MYYSTVSEIGVSSSNHRAISDYVVVVLLSAVISFTIVLNILLLSGLTSSNRAVLSQYIEQLGSKVPSCRLVIILEQL